MKFVLNNYWSSWSGDTAIAAGLACAVGNNLKTRLMTAPTISGLHVGCGYIFGQMHLWIGVEPKRTNPDLKGVKLEKL